jgi:hypothetical protein
MRRIDSVDLGKLIWKQKQFGAHDFELRSDEELVGSMYWTKWFSDRAIAETADGAWELDRPGFFRDRVLVTERQSGIEIAVFDKGWFGEGTLSLRGGRSMEWHRTKAFCNHWALSNEEDEIILEIREGMRWFKHEADVVLHPGADKESDLPLLILVGWYLVFMSIQDSAAVVAATSSGI